MATPARDSSTKEGLVPHHTTPTYTLQRRDPSLLAYSRGEHLTKSVSPAVNTAAAATVAASHRRGPFSHGTEANQPRPGSTHWAHFRILFTARRSAHY